ncbi:MAG: LD-carboxypeptidase [Candidatus Marinimicrobia bacterium]|nr:LD-carboxypeptidase [Candidatus Neomarinimicrobiota bacterium]
MKTYQTPNPIKQGDTIGIIAPASAAKRKSTQLGLEYLKKQGYQIKLSPHLNRAYKYLAAPDEIRVRHLQDFLLDSEIHHIFCVRGGYGLLRIIDKIDYEKLKSIPPKTLVGYSDITALQLSLLKKLGWVTYSGPMVASEMGNDFSQFSENWLWKVLTLNNGQLNFQNPADDPIKIFRQGQARGNLIGGCFSLITPLLGTTYLPDLEGAILFIEDVGEPAYKIDKFLQYLKLHGVFHKISGLIIGKFSGAFKEKDRKNFTLEELLQDTLPEVDIPIITNFAYGHVKQRFTMPVGGKFKIDTARNEYIYFR